MRIPNGAHSGQWCERLAVRGNNGTYVYVAHELSAARVIGELVPSVWVKADRPGLQLLVRVTLPRTADPRTGKPLTTLLRGTAYSQVGVWQQLRLDDLTGAIERQVRVLRAQFGRDVDAREAFVDRVLLNVYGGPGVTNVLVDDLEVAGVVAPQATVSAVSTSPQDRVRAGADVMQRDLPPLWAGGAGVPKVERSGSLLLVDGTPFFPRAIEYRGEVAGAVCAPWDSTSRGWIARPRTNCCAMRPPPDCGSSRRRRPRQRSNRAPPTAAVPSAINTTQCWPGTWVEDWAGVNSSPRGSGPSCCKQPTPVTDRWCARPTRNSTITRIRQSTFNWCAATCWARACNSASTRAGCASDRN